MESEIEADALEPDWDNAANNQRVNIAIINLNLVIQPKEVDKSFWASQETKALWLGLDTLDLAMSVVTHLVLALPVRSRLRDASFHAKNSGFILASQELLLLLLVLTRRSWYFNNRLPIALASRIFRLLLHVAVWMEWPTGASVILLDADSAVESRTLLRAALHSLLMTAVQSFMHITSLGLPFPLQACVAAAKAVADITLAIPASVSSISLNACLRDEVLRLCRWVDLLMAVITASPSAIDESVMTCRHSDPTAFLTFTDLLLGTALPLALSYCYELRAKLRYLHDQGYTTAGVSVTRLGLCLVGLIACMLAWQLSQASLVAVGWLRGGGWLSL